MIIFIGKIKSSHVIFSKHTHDTKRDHGSLKKSSFGSNLLSCGPNECQILSKISISENNTFNCKDDVLMINFDLTTTFRNQTKITQPSYGYIYKDNNVITEKIETSSCKNIKKYFFLSLFNINLKTS
jgi:hypothetical protein